MIVTYFYHAQAKHVLPKDWLRRMIHVAGSPRQSIGLSVDDVKAAVEAWFDVQTALIRAPKYDITQSGHRWHRLVYRHHRNPTAGAPALSALADL